MRAIPGNFRYFLHLIVSSYFHYSYFLSHENLLKAGAGAVSLQAFNQAIVLDASRSQTFYLRGLLEHGLGYPMKALKDFTEASKLDPEHAPSRYMTGVCLQVRDELLSVKSFYEHALL